MQIDRRSLLAGAAFATAFGLAEYLRPKQVMQMAGDRELADLVPETFGSWASEHDPTLIVPPTEGGLTDRLYDQLLMRRYRNESSREEIFLLIAYGGSQTDDLQIHRPESCYPAVGMRILDRELETIEIAGREIPGVSLLAHAPGRYERILYWSRIGDRFPTSASAQRDDKLQFAFKGIIPDGALIRASSVSSSPDQDTEILSSFLSDLGNSLDEEAARVLLA